MNCRKCGNTLGNNVKFCSKCGTSVSEVNNSALNKSNSSTIELNHLQGFSFSLSGREFGFSGIYYACTLAQRTITLQMEDFQNRLEAVFSTKVKNMDTVFKYGLPCFFEEFEKLVHAVYMLLISSNIAIDKSKSEIRDLVYNACNLETQLKPFFDANQQLSDVADEICNCLGQKRASRSHWEGGGFGIGGAIKGAINAAILNYGTNFIRSIGDRIENRHYKARYDDLDMQIYREMQPIKLLRVVLAGCGMWISKLICSLFGKQFDDHSLATNIDKIEAYDNRYKNAFELYKFTNKDSDFDAMKKAFFERIQLFPFDAYVYLDLARYTMADFGEIERVIDMLNIQCSYGLLYIGFLDDLKSKLDCNYSFSSYEAETVVGYINWLKTSSYYDFSLDDTCSKLIASK